MLNAYQPIEDLVENVKGTTNFLSSLISRKSGLAFLFVVLGVLVSKLLIN